MHLHDLKSKQLSKSTIYEYKVGSVRENTSTIFWSPVYQFHTPDSSPGFKFVAAADMVWINHQ